MKNIFFLFLTMIWIGNLSAQGSKPEVVASAGDSFEGSSMQIDWTLGELAITTIQSSSQQITQGFHQQNYTITSVKELPPEIGQIRVFPNPTVDRIEMKLHFDQNRKVKIQLVDMNGRMIWSTEKNGQIIEVTNRVGFLSSGNYFLHFQVDENKYSQTFGIHKLN